MSPFRKIVESRLQDIESAQENRGHPAMTATADRMMATISDRLASINDYSSCLSEAIWTFCVP
jgi:2-hydroxychromene-2-carboxylate isomerase